MSKKIYLVALIAMSLASCTNDEVIEIQQNAIKFNVVADNTSRAENVYCNNNMPDNFKVWAYYTKDSKDVMYINGDVVKKEGDNYVTDETRYWPEDKTLTFVALKNMGDILISMGGGVTQQNGFSANTDVTKQVDLIYAVATEQTKDNNAESGVNLNFRHALSQIVFSAKNTNPKLHVEITGVIAGNIANQGTFFPSTSTSDKYGEHNGGETEIKTGLVDWTGVSNMEGTDFTVNFDKAVVLDGKGTKLSLTSAIETGKEFSSTAMLLVPQTTVAWDPKKGKPDAENTAVNENIYGAYIGVNCKIWNIAGEEFNSTTDELLHEGKALIPISIKWEQGRKYHYTFIFGEGNGGWTDEPKPVLSPITYNVTVDDFVPVDEIEKEMKGVTE